MESVEEILIAGIWVECAAGEVERGTSSEDGFDHNRKSFY
jgi:hypothetical protein